MFLFGFIISASLFSFLFLASFTSFLDFILSVILCPAYNLFLLFLKLPGFSFVHVNFSFSKNYFLSILFFLLKYLFLSLFSTYHCVHFYQSNLKMHTGWKSSEEVFKANIFWGPCFWFLLHLCYQVFRLIFRRVELPNPPHLICVHFYQSNRS